MNTVTTIAGFDPSSGAGITADLLVFAAHGLFGTSCVTALTVQNTLGVRTSHAVAAETVAETLLCLEDDLPPAGIKIGMLANAEIVTSVARFLHDLRQRRPVIVVLDPIIRSSLGADLLDSFGLQCMQEELLPYVDWITPNVAELEALTGKAARSDDQIAAAAALLQAKGRGLNVIVTRGDAIPPVDFVLQHARQAESLPGEHVPTTSTHGTGCAFSSALLSQLVLRKQPLQAAQAAKTYVAGALRSATPRGKGRGPMNHLWLLKPTGDSA